MVVKADRLFLGFKRHLRVDPGPGGAVYVTSARGTTALEGTLVHRLAPLLDGTRTVAEIRRAMAPWASEGRLGHMLGRLAQANLVGFQTTSRTAADAYWDLAGIDGAGAGATSTSVAVIGLAGAQAAADACRAAGLTVTQDQRRADALLVLCADYLDPRLAEINAQRLADGRPWLLATACGPDVWVGPAFEPENGPCWECLAARLRRRRTGTPGPPEASLAPTRALGMHLAVLELTKWLAGAASGLREQVWTLDTVNLALSCHPVTSRPQCPACGDRDTTRVSVTPSPTAATGSTPGNSHRAMPLEDVWERYRHLADPVTGITDPIRPDPRSPRFVHCYLSGRNLALDGEEGAGVRQWSGGKGRTDLEARVSALGEAVERYCGTRLGDEQVVRGSFHELRGDAVHPDTCQLFHPRQYADRVRWNAGAMPFQQIPEPFDDRAVIDWTPVRSLTTDAQRLLPTDLLYFNGGAGVPSLRATSNGNAAGASLADATVQGFLELVERDAVALWWYNMTRQPVIDQASFGDPFIAEVFDGYAGLNRALWLLDLTSDLGVPVVAAISRRTDKPAQDIMLGFGAHFDVRIAVRRALTELGQLLSAVVDAKADGTGYAPADEHLMAWWRNATTADQPYLLPDRDRAPRRLTDYREAVHGDLEADLDTMHAIAERHDLDVLLLDQTRPDVGMPVVKVTVPGLRHFWARFAPGRLYDVPVRLGRLRRPTAYRDLNPTPLFL
ncbi:TOMM precursor leader peptide-binding protein [Nonomuraea longispora]|uniref:TOMM leader peptide-binding protein n=1 Tax=Nonomuraea longispora TaxID=1848320 RepID=A0A4R4NKZ0_9ACTN|nr:TOMM precursor leader peptide-binding protein [Nonomuraea longispora]TDC10068.1 TOMM precursor leader peptide-binding protein [Nonomuraea longispora]